MKYILITGGAARLGRKIAEYFIKKNDYKIIIHYNSSDTSALALQEQYEQVTLIKCDFTKAQEVAKLLNEIKHVDILINNASIFKNDHIEDATEAGFAEHMQVNFLSPVILSRNFANKFKRGHIINIVDSWAYNIPQNFASYVLSKNALRNFTALSYKEFAPLIMINAISLGFTLYNEAFPKDFFECSQQKYPSSTELVCLAIDFILSEKINGRIIDLCKWRIESENRKWK